MVRIKGLCRVFPIISSKTVVGLRENALIIPFLSIGRIKDLCRVFPFISSKTVVALLEKGTAYPFRQIWQHHSKVKTLAQGIRMVHILIQRDKMVVFLAFRQIGLEGSHVRQQFCFC